MIRTKSVAIMSGVALIALTACEPLQPGDPGYREQTGATTGALFGGLIGAAAGNGRGTGALGGAAIGAAAGAIAGGAIGRTLDAQAGELRGSLDNDIDVVNTGNELVVTMPNGLLFPFDSDQISPSLMDDLREVARSLQRYPNSTVEVVGHTDNVGEAGYNLDLSKRRANAVASVLYQYGVRASRVVTIGRGESQPVATNLNEAGRAQNRRVEIIIRPTS